MSYCASRSCQHKAPEVASDARQLFGKIKPPEKLSVTRSHLGGFDKTALKNLPDVTTWPTSALSNVNILIFFITILVTLKPTVLLLNTYVLQKHGDWKKPWKKKKKGEFRALALFSSFSGFVGSSHLLDIPSVLFNALHEFYVSLPCSKII